ncbi:MAG: glutaminyl-peptide cyclotransferase [Vicinamibacterales bacterium]
MNGHERRGASLAAVLASGVAALAVAAATAGAGTGSVHAQPTGGAQARPAARTVRHEVVRRYPHDPDAFTQGLIVRDGFLFESTGLNGRSSLRQVRLETGEVVREVAVENRYFAEGLTDWGPRLIQLTWVSNIAFVYDLATLRRTTTFTYGGEGWGLTHDEHRLILSDGSPVLRFLDPESFREIGRLTVRDAGTPLEELNELEFVDGRVLANVWRSDRIAVIDPALGDVVGWVDLAGLLPDRRPLGDDVLNGIAHDAATGRLFVTGKLWPWLFEIRLESPLP